MRTHQLTTPKVFLAVVAHPDDIEYSIGGSVAKWVREGCEAYYYILTNGNKGSSDPSANPSDVQETRRAEQRAAADLLGVKDVFFGDYDDCCLQCSLGVKKNIARVIRQVKPEVVFTYDPSMLYAADEGFINHPDHRAAGQATLDAVFPLARDHLSFPELLAEGHEPHKTKTILLNNLERQNCYVDITDTLQLKLDALFLHASQFTDQPAITKAITNMAIEAGKVIDTRYAEAFLCIDIA